ncbi:MAG TPA: arylsulfotransferase family protein, partial [Candidatus Hydrogenedentes bacterium]|nr:arylsulfotransferase family protein [Candidatus Hydrogenedentota bacterium]
AIFEGLGVIKVDRDSRLIWANPCRAHHDLEVMPDGDIYVLARAARIVDYVDPNRPILEDFVLVLDEHGKEKRRVSLLHAFEHSKYRAFWRKSGKRRGDIFHTNTLEVLDGRIAGRIPEFTAGNILTSMLNLDAIAVVDMDREQVVWAQRGKFRRQHDPQVLENGNLLLFDNRGLPGQSRVLEFDPDDMSLVWSYQGTEAAPFYSRTCGVCQRLPNGNTLITETDNGRAFEVTPAGEIVWEFYNPERAGKQLEFIAALFVVLRLPPDFPLDWLESRGP